MGAARSLRVHKQAWVICSVAAFMLFAGYLRDWPFTGVIRLMALPFVLLAAAALGWVLQFFWGLSDGIRARSSKASKRLVLVASLLLGAGAVGGYLGKNLILRQYDAVR